jgi:hypothetical protein
MPRRPQVYAADLLRSPDSPPFSATSGDNTSRASLRCTCGGAWRRGTGDPGRGMCLDRVPGWTRARATVPGRWPLPSARAAGIAAATPDTPPSADRLALRLQQHDACIDRAEDSLPHNGHPWESTTPRAVDGRARPGGSRGHTRRGTGRGPKKAPDLRTRLSERQILSRGSRAAPGSVTGDAASTSSSTRSAGCAHASRRRPCRSRRASWADRR